MKKVLLTAVIAAAFVFGMVACNCNKNAEPAQEETTEQTEKVCNHECEHPACTCENTTCAEKHCEGCTNEECKAKCCMHKCCEGEKPECCKEGAECCKEGAECCKPKCCKEGEHKCCKEGEKKECCDKK